MTDLISRQAAIDLAKDIYVPTKDGSNPDAIRELPSAQPEIIRCGCGSMNMNSHENLNQRKINKKLKEDK